MPVKKYVCRDCKEPFWIKSEVNRTPKFCPNCRSTRLKYLKTDRDANLLDIIGRVIVGYYEWALFYLSKKYKNRNEREAWRRWDICLRCEYLTKNNRCAKCGCFMYVKTKGESSRCVLNKW